MPKNIQVKNVPDDVHAVHRRRAKEAGQSLQEYLVAMLTETAHRPTVAEVLSRAATRGRGRVTLAEAADVVRADRDTRA